MKKRKAKTASKRSVKKVPKKSAKKVRRKPAAKPAKRKVSKKAGKRRPNAAFMRPVLPDATLAAVVGASALPRTELAKKIWFYIKRNGLQDKRNRRMINADDKLRAVFGGEQQVNMFRMTSLVNKHVVLEHGGGGGH